MSDGRGTDMSNELSRGNRLLHMGCWCGVLVALLLENKAIAALGHMPSDVPPVAWGGCEPTFDSPASRPIV